MKKTALFITVLTAASLLFSCAHNGEYKRIDLQGEALGESGDEIQLDVIGTITPQTKVENITSDSYPDKMSIYEISPRNITNEELKAVADYMDMDGEITEKNGAPIIETADGRRLYLFKNFKNYMFLGRTADYVEMTQTDEEIEAQAKAIFNDLPIIEGEYECLGVTYVTTVSDGDDSYIVRKTISFRRLVDDLRVIGDDFCDLDFAADGLCALQLRLYDYEKTGELDMLSLDDAVDKVKTPDAFGLYSDTNRNFSGAADKLKIERTKLLFVNQYSNGCEILQPVFNLTGTAENEDGSVEFAARIIAIPEKYTHE